MAPIIPIIPIIHCLLPYKETYTPQNAGAVALTVEGGFTNSAFSKNAVIFGRDLSTPSLGDTLYKGLAPRQSWLMGKNIGLARAYLHHIKQHGAPDLLEVHGRLQVAEYIGRKRPDLNMGLYLHNDPRDMKAGKTVSMRRALLDRMTVIYCVSDFLRSCFLDGIHVSGEDAEKVIVIPIAADRLLKQPPSKDKLISIIGRMVPEKGMLAAAEALASVLPRYPDWNVIFAGAQRFEDAPPSAYEASIADALDPIREQAIMTGFIPRPEIMDIQNRSAIILAPSEWQEPAGRVVIEALACGAALITSRRGGIPEYAEGRAIILDEGKPADLAEALERLITDENWRLSWQKKAWADYPFDTAHMLAKLDKARYRALGITG